VQCYEAHTRWSGTIIAYLPGHKPDVVRDDKMVANCKTLLDYLLAR